MAVGAVVTQPVVEDDQHTVRNGHDGFLLAPAARQTVELSRQIVARGVGNRPRDLAEDGLEPGVAWGGRSAQAFAAALLVAGTDPRPGGEMPMRREPVHV